MMDDPSRLRMGVLATRTHGILRLAPDWPRDLPAREQLAGARELLALAGASTWPRRRWRPRTVLGLGVLG